jgi:hypothetical protein
MKKTLKPVLVLLLILLCSDTFSQASKIYNEKRKLIVDTTFQISEKSYDLFSRYENIVMTRLYDHLYYPKIARELNIHGLVIARISFDKNTRLEVELAKGVDPFIDTLVVNKLKKIKGNIEFLRNCSECTEYFIPVKFEINKRRVEQDLEENNSLIFREYEYIQYKVIMQYYNLE